MKVISFLSRFTLICNIAFILFIFFSKIEAKKPVSHGRDIVDTIPFFKSLVITLGFSAIIINLLMCIVYAIIIIIGKRSILSKWLTAVNFVFLIFQFCYFFFR